MQFLGDLTRQSDEAGVAAGFQHKRQSVGVALVNSRERLIGILRTTFIAGRDGDGEAHPPTVPPVFRAPEICLSSGNGAYRLGLLCTANFARSSASRSMGVDGTDTIFRIRLGVTNVLLQCDVLNSPSVCDLACVDGKMLEMSSLGCQEKNDTRRAK